MRKVNYLLITAVLFAFSATAQEIKLGVRGGLNFANITKNQPNNLSTRIGFNLGGVVDIGLSEHFSIQPGLQISTKGAKSGSDYIFRTTYLEVPVYALYHYKLEKISFFGGAGPYLALGVGGQEIAGGNRQSIAWGESGAWHRGDAGLGFILGIEIKPGFQAGINYDLGLVNIHKQANGGDNITAYNRVFGLFIGYMFDLSK